MLLLSPTYVHAFVRACTHGSVYVFSRMMGLLFTSPEVNHSMFFHHMTLVPILDSVKKRLLPICMIRMLAAAAKSGVKSRSDSKDRNLDGRKIQLAKQSFRSNSQRFMKAALTVVNYRVAASEGSGCFKVARSVARADLL
jgi:hypothetical protein